MTDAELRRAMEPVREHFFGREITVNTVLAAYLRAHGLPASGRPWELAKATMQSGGDFDQAVTAAQGVAAAATLEAQEAEDVWTDSSVGLRPHPPRQTLDWIPKRFGPGDIDGVGARRLLGTPNLDPTWVLVRETAQNSWDARGASTEIDFTLNLRRLDAAGVDFLRERIFTGDAPRTGLPELLTRDELWVLEISDRGTVGLTGPIRNDRMVDQGEDTNFIDLVFNIGAPRDVHLGAGTYGFGKTIAYVTSSVGAVLIWSRCEGRNGLEHRLIGSAMSDGFDHDGHRYTGRHWWGVGIPGADRVEPAVGEGARDLAQAVFAGRYPDRSTGTSIIILDPQLGGADREEDVQRLADAVTWNLWPKLVAHDGNRARMRISVELDGQPVRLPSIEDHTELSGHARCLLAVRAAQSTHGRAAPASPYPVTVHEIWCKLPSTLLGHLALTRYPSPRGTRSPSHSITLMRHQAELVVKQLERRELDVEGFQWAGVFKPVADVDDSFAMAEPPAHDDWIPKAVKEKARRRQVNVALQRIREAADEWLVPRTRDRSDAKEVSSVAHIGDMLAGLVAGADGTISVHQDPSSDEDQGGAGTGSRGTAQGGRATRGGNRRPVRPRVELVDTAQAPAPEPGWLRTTLDVKLADVAVGGAMVEVNVQVGVDGGSLADDSAVRILGWHDRPDGPFDPQPQRIRQHERFQYTFDSRSDLAIDVQTRLVEY
ncbi:hypothetical protein ACIOBK_22025 [Micromonospora chokoriensis]